MLWGGLIWDDFIWAQSRAVLEWSGLSTIWSWPSRIHQEAHYWPLTYTTFWLEHKIWGLAPAGYHVVNVLLHLLNSLLVWRLLLRLAVPGAWVAAAVFAAHPTHVESVAWIIERKDVLSGLFYLTAVLVWLRFLEQPRPWRYGLALLLFAAGLLSKSIVVTLPAALLILQWWKDGRIAVRDLRRLAPFFLVALLITAVDLYSVRFKAQSPWTTPCLSGCSSRRGPCGSTRASWPGQPIWLSSTHGGTSASGTLGHGSTWPGRRHWRQRSWFMRLRVGRGPLAGALFFAVTLSPVLGFVNHGYMQYSFVADRFQYLAGIGVIAVLIGAAVHGASRLSGGLKLGAAGLVGVMLALLGTTTWRQAEIYRNDVTYFSHIVSLNPEARNAHYNLSDALAKAGRREEALAKARIAEEILRRALEIDPNHKNTRYYIAEILRLQSRDEEALEAYRAVLEIDPTYAPAHAYMGYVLLQLHRYAEAIKPLNKALILIKAAPSLTSNLPTAGTSSCPPG